MKTALIVLLFPLSILTFQTCKTEEGVSGSIRILGVAPNAGLVDGVARDFVIEVDYELSNIDQGELNVGFNTMSQDWYLVVSSETVVVNERSGQHTFNVNVVPTDWAPGGSFKAYVNISEYPHESSWKPLDDGFLQQRRRESAHCSSFVNAL